MPRVIELTRSWVLALVLSLGLLGETFAFAPSEPLAAPAPPEFKKVGIDQTKLGQSIRLDTEFTNAEGEKVKLAQYFNQGKPVMVLMVYYRCPMLCPMTLSALNEGLGELDWTPGDKFDVLTISVDPAETAAMAKTQKTTYIGRLNKPEAADHWNFLVGEEPEIAKLAGDLGFGFEYDPKSREYAHDSALYLLTEDGRIARILPGLQYTPDKLRLAILEAGEGKIGNILDQIFLQCFHFDPSTGNYYFAQNAMRIGGLITLVLLFGPIGFFIWKERRAARAKGAMGQEAPVHTTVSQP